MANGDSHQFVATTHFGGQHYVVLRIFLRQIATRVRASSLRHRRDATADGESKPQARPKTSSMSSPSLAAAARSYMLTGNAGTRA